MFDEPIGTYHADTVHIGSSQAKLFQKSRSLFYESVVLGNAKPFSSDSLTLGKHWHTLRELGPEKFGELAVVVPSQFITAGGALSTKKDAKEWVDSLAPNQIPLTPDISDTLGRMQDLFDQNTAAVEIEETTLHREVSIRWTSTAGVKLRARPDVLCEGGRLADWKSTRVGSIDEEFRWAVRDFGYGLSAAIYEQGCLVSGLAEPPMVFVVTQTVEPWETQVITLPPAYMDFCRKQLDELLVELAGCRATGNWLPRGYGEVRELSMPGFGDRVSFSPME